MCSANLGGIPSDSDLGLDSSHPVAGRVVIMQATDHVASVVSISPTTGGLVVSNPQYSAFQTLYASYALPKPYNTPQQGIYAYDAILTIARAIQMAKSSTIANNGNGGALQVAYTPL